MARPLAEVEVFIFAWSCRSSVSVRLDTAQSDGCYLNPVLKFDLAACINTDMLQSLTGEVILGLEGPEDLVLIDTAGLVCIYRTTESVSVQM